jgi:uroporphyrinogen-III synthase
VTRPALVLRPDPGNAATAARLEAVGLRAIRLPLFATVALPWAVPAADRYDVLLLTSANAVRHAGQGLDSLRSLPVVAVGDGTATAARAAGLAVAATGAGDAADALALARARGWTRVLRLAGRDRTALRAVVDVPVYASEAVSPPAGQLAAARGSVALLHSARAADWLSTLLDRERVARRDVRVAALSPAVAQAAGPGWAGIAVAAMPTDAALVTAAGMLAIDP